MLPIRLKTLVFGENEITVVLPDRIAEATPAPTPAPTRPPTNAAINTTLSQPLRVLSRSGSEAAASAVGGSEAAGGSDAATNSSVESDRLPAAPRGSTPGFSSAPCAPPPSLSTFDVVARRRQPGWAGCPCRLFGARRFA